MNKLGDSPDYEELYNEINSKDKLINNLKKEVEVLKKERHSLLLNFYKELKSYGKLHSDNEELMMNDYEAYVNEFLNKKS